MLLCQSSRQILKNAPAARRLASPGGRRETARPKRARWAGRAHAALRSAQGALVLLGAALHLPRLQESRAVLPSCSVLASLCRSRRELSNEVLYVTQHDDFA